MNNERRKQMTQEALKLALEALKGVLDDAPKVMDASIAGGLYEVVQCRDAITAIKEALAQPEQEPLAWISTGPARMIHWTADKPAYGDDWVPLYTTPQQRTWVGLTKEEIAEFDTWHDHREEEVGWCNPSEIVAYIEAKLKEKNA
jgi:hypothetical protein